MKELTIQVLKKDGTLEDFNSEKIINAIRKSANRVIVDLTEMEEIMVVEEVYNNICKTSIIDGVPVKTIHNYVETALQNVNPIVAESYRSYRNYKTDFVGMLDEVYSKAQSVLYIGDKENSNADSSLVSTKRSLITGHLSKELYQKFFLTESEREAIKKGFIYIHDMRDRLYCLNCCLADVANIMRGGFEMGNIWYNEPKSVDVACDVLGDIILSMASQQYGGYTVPEVDTVLAYYCEKSYEKYKEEYISILKDNDGIINEDRVHEYAVRKVYRDLEQGIQGLEIKLNTVASSRGDYPFTTFTFGIDKSEFGKMVTEVILKVRMGGQGKPGFKKQVLFPKLSFLYDENLHGEDQVMEYLFNIACECSSKSMYPDYLSLTGDGYVAEMYKKYGLVVSGMGCRAYLSPYFERGGMNPADENDKPYFIGRFNIGAITLHLPLIYQEAKTTGQDFYKLLDYYLEMIRGLHIRTYEYLGKMKASTNPLGFTQGGFVGGTLEYDECIAPVLKSATASFGFTALNELCQLHYGKSIREDNSFANEVIDYINDRIDTYKKADGNLYALYATPKCLGI